MTHRARFGLPAVAAVLALALSGSLTPATASPVYYTDWTSRTVATSGSATGVINTNTGPVSVTYTGQVISTTQTGCGAGYWTVNSSIYTSGVADNPPLPCDMIGMTGGAGVGVSTFSFDRPILNPILSVLSLGQGGIAAVLEFDQPFVILSQGSGYFGGGSDRLVDLGPNARGGDTLQGREGHGTIMFTGAFQTLTWTMPVFENWYGFTIGVQGIATPTPGALPVLGLGLLALAAWRRRKP